MHSRAHGFGYVNVAALETMAERVTDLKQRFLQHLAIQSGQRVLDVGCGPATDTIEMGHAVGKEGWVIGVDHDHEMVQRAEERVRFAGCGGWTRHITADAYDLPFRSDTFDCCHCERLLQHVDDGAKILSEMVRVTVPGGRLAVADTDWASLSIDSPEIEIERRVTGGIAKLIRNGFAGRQLFRLLTEQGLVDLDLSVHPIVWTDWPTFRQTSFAIANLDEHLAAAGLVTAEQWQQFLTSLEAANARGCFFATGNLVLVVGTKPKLQRR